MDRLRQDVLYALRVLAKDRAYSMAVILTLAVCLGANTAIFTVVRSVLLRPLPYPQADRTISGYAASPAPASNVPVRQSRTMQTAAP